MITFSELQSLLQTSYNKNIKLSIIKDSDCWTCYSHYSDTDGYIIVCDKNRKQSKLHRIVYQLVIAPIVGTNLVRHSCDNPSCVNPAHLLQGTHQDNKDDAVARSRHAIGERNRHAILIEEDIPLIRASGKSHKRLALEYGVSPACIQQIKNGTTWKHV